MSIIISVYLFLLGAALGSFCNMLVYRLPRHESLGGHSYCDVTGKRLKWIDLIPILSYILFLGKCRECGGKLPIKYPLIELSNGLLFVIAFIVLSPSNLAIYWMISIYIVLEIIFIDIAAWNK